MERGTEDYGPVSWVGGEVERAVGEVPELVLMLSEDVHSIPDFG